MLQRLRVHPDWQYERIVLQNLTVAVVVTFDCFLKVIARLKDDLVATIVLTSQSESHILRAGLVQRGEVIVPWHTLTQNYCLEGVNVIDFFLAKLLRDILVFAVVLGAIKLIVGKPKHKKADVTRVLKRGFSNYTDCFLFL